MHKGNPGSRTIQPATFTIAGEIDPNHINQCVDQIFISKSLERIADHATNLAEEIIYLTTAQDTRHQGH
jgi:phosphate uptake regulator